jgi:GNAT superfamily N-acetyltransferase
MAIGGLFTHSEFQGQGIGNKIMDAAERFVFADRGAELILPFCLASLREFYSERG